jgi:hypothetical protein
MVCFPGLRFCPAHHASDLRKASIVIRVVKLRNLLWGDLFGRRSVRRCIVIRYVHPVVVIVVIDRFLVVVWRRTHHSKRCYATCFGEEV